MNRNHSRAGPLLTASLAVTFTIAAGLPAAHSQSAPGNRCTPSIVAVDGFERETQHQSLKEVGAELAKRNADIDSTVKAVGAHPTPPSNLEQIRALEAQLEALSRAAHALEDQITTVSSTTTNCNPNPKD